MSEQNKVTSFSASIRAFFEEVRYWLKWGGVQTLVVLLIAFGLATFALPQIPQLKATDQLLFGLVCLAISAMVSAAVAFKQRLDVCAVLWWVYAGAIIAFSFSHFGGQTQAVISAVVFVIITVLLFVLIHKANTPVAKLAGDGKAAGKPSEKRSSAETTTAQAAASLAVETVKGKLIDLGANTETDVQARATTALAEAKRVQIEERAQALRDYEFALNNKDQYTKEELEILKRRAHQFDAPRSAEPKKEKKEPRFRSGTKKSVTEW